MKSISIRILLVGLIISIILIFQTNQSFGTIISSERRIAWNPGIPGGIPDYPVGANVKDYGAVGNGSADDTQAFKNAISATPKGTALLIPAGTYKITSGLSCNKGIAIRGAGHNQTKINFSGSGTFISVNGSYGTNWISWTGGYTKGSNKITVSSTSGLAVGSWIVINQSNDGNCVSCDGSYVAGQIMKVTNVSGNTLTLDRQLYYTYDSGEDNRVRELNMIEGFGLEKLHVNHLTSGGSGSNVNFLRVVHSWVKQCKFTKTRTAHIFVNMSARNEFRGNYLYHSWLYGTGGKGYGFRVEQRSSDNLMEDNIVQHMRHSFVFQYGAAGNVVGYNYSYEPFLEPGNNWFLQDIVPHGNWCTMNLFEGNVVQRIVVDNVHGRNGPHTFFRNRIEKDVDHYLNYTEKWPFFDVERNNPTHNFVGNELGTAEVYSTKPIELEPGLEDTILVHGNYNYHDDEIDWDPGISDHNLPNSYYLNSKPSWLGSLPWPVIGGDVSPNNYNIPAKQRFLDGTYIPGDENMPDPGQEPMPEPPQNLRIIN